MFDVAGITYHSTHNTQNYTPYHRNPPSFTISITTGHLSVVSRPQSRIHSTLPSHDHATKSRIPFPALDKNTRTRTV